jgi:DNA polymerase elongation subunit (family B)
MFIIDTEVYKDYFLLSMLRLRDGKIRHFEFHADAKLDVTKITALFRTETVISFNGNSYDIPIISAAIAGYSNQHIKDLSDAIIKSNQPSWTILRSHNFDLIKTDHIDLIEVAPGQSSLKIYGGRMNAPKMQDLPIEPGASISPEQRAEMREYCENDLYTTELLYRSLKPQIDLRVALSEQYGMDLRSKSDAQIAETVIISEMTKITKQGYGKVAIKDNAEFSYLDPMIVSFNNPELNALIINLCTHRFTLGLNGAVQMPDWLRNTKIKIGTSEYQMGIGGLHSCEKSQYIKADDEHILFELDVRAYYPNIILQQQLAPKSMGAAFLNIYQSLVNRRVFAKQKVKDIEKEIEQLEKILKTM